MYNYQLNFAEEGDRIDFMIDRGLDEVKCTELLEHEPKLWGPARDKMMSKWNNFGKEEDSGETTGSTGGEDAGGDDDE